MSETEREGHVKTKSPSSTKTVELREHTTSELVAPDEQPVVVPTPEAGRAPLVRPAAPRAAVHVAPHSLDLARVATDPFEEHAAEEQRDLNHLVHHVLIIGLVISAVLMVVGVVLGLVYQRELPTTVPTISEVVARVLALRPSGFLALGLLVLIATPILRVIGSIGAFLYERDWHYAGITGVVLLVLVISIVLGRG